MFTNFMAWLESYSYKMVIPIIVGKFIYLIVTILENVFTVGVINQYKWLVANSVIRVCVRLSQMGTPRNNLLYKKHWHIKVVIF